jgi:hypothetical protein
MSVAEKLGRSSPLACKDMRLSVYSESRWSTNDALVDLGEELLKCGRVAGIPFFSFALPLGESERILTKTTAQEAWNAHLLGTALRNGMNSTRCAPGTQARARRTTMLLIYVTIVSSNSTERES